MTARRRLAGIGLAAVMVVGASGCLQQPGGGGEGGVGGVVADNAQPDGDSTVTILGAFGGAEQEAFEASLAAFEDESGIDIEYTADSDFTTTIKQKVNSGDAPDIGFFPQPGGLLELAGQDKIQAIDTFLDYDKLDETLVPGFLESARLNGRVYGAPMRMAIKSVVWYPKKAWDEAGYPKEFATYQELMDFSQQLVDDGQTPWCMGWESEAATGWVGTDWLEEMVLRVAGPDVYDQWVTHKIPFNDPAIVESLDIFGDLAKNPDLVYGGVRGVLNTPFSEAGLPSFDNPPKCWMERQGNFVTGFYPEEVQGNLDEEVGQFVFPPYEGGYEGTPVLGGGDIAALFNGNDEDAQAVMEFLTSDQFGAEWAQAGGWLSPHATFDASNYPDETTRTVAEIAANASVFRYDASDVMPKSVGSGTFWTEMVKWLNGESSEDATTAIEDSWPTS